MCGIVGAVGLGAEPDPDLAGRILSSIEHRGPDAEGHRYREGIWFGFRRLAIQDLARRADQPMVDDATGVTLLYNGEIYNFVELRSELESQGHVFVTTGDTEVLLRGYLEWGMAVFERCNGMWAAAIDDPRRDGVLLARDRFGEKPLHLGRAADGSWWFSSEVRPLVVAGLGRRQLDLVRARGFLTLGDVEDPARSYVAGITQVPPGCTMLLTRRGPSPATTVFDLGQFVREAVHTAPSAVDDVLDALDTSVRLRLRSDVEVGTSLSGGLDSSMIVASLRSIDPGRVLHTFTASFPGRSIDEWDRAETVGEQFGVVLHRVEPTAEGFLADLDAVVDHQAGPIESPTVYAQWCVMRRARDEGVTVLLDGQGADETWGGYPKYFTMALADALGRGRPSQALDMLRAWRSAGALPLIDPRQSAGLVAPPVVRRPMQSGLARMRARDLGPALRDVVADDPQGDKLSGAVLARAAQADLGRVILPRLLRYADRNSMAWSRELRLPYLDPQLATMALASSWSAGFRTGWTKAALRRAASGRLPDAITWRRDKTAYETPNAEWLARPDVAGAVDDAARVLHGVGLLAGPQLGSLNPWRVLSLGRLVEQYGLTA